MALSKKCKELLCLFYSCLLFISGIVLIVLSVYFAIKLTHHFKFVVPVYIVPFILLVILGFIHLLLTWLGIRGSKKEHLFNIILFMVFTFVLIILEVTIGIWSMVLRGQVGDKSLPLMKNSFFGFIKDDYDKSNWVNLQSQFQCCGVNNVSDYTTIGSSSGSIPISCCNSSSTTACTSIFQDGCKEPLVKYVRKIMLNNALAGFGSGLFQILGLVLFYYFHKAIKQDILDKAKLRELTRAQEVNPLNRKNSETAKRNVK